MDPWPYGSHSAFEVSLYSRERGLSSIYAQDPDMGGAYWVADIPRFTQPTTAKERESTFSCPTTPSEHHSSPLPPSDDKSELIRAHTITPLSPVFVRTQRVSVVSHHVTPQYTATSPV